MLVLLLLKLLLQTSVWTQLNDFEGPPSAWGPMGDLSCLIDGKRAKKTTEVWIVDDQEEKGYDRGMTNPWARGHFTKAGLQATLQLENIDLIGAETEIGIQPALETPASILLAL